MISDQVHWWEYTRSISGVHQPFYILVEVAFIQKVEDLLS